MSKKRNAATTVPAASSSSASSTSAATIDAVVRSTATVSRKERPMILDVSRLLFARHLRAEPTSHVLFFKDGALKKSGPGLAFWFMPLGASVSAVPLDDRE
ncbi:MAG TPA: hypothetical protein VGF99_20265, partial [Myxococcota bacterium]